ncbi:MAG: phosphoglucomutase [Candidatus Margulisiibacteriota bacterium]
MTIHQLAGQKPERIALVTREAMRQRFWDQPANTFPVKNGTSGHRGLTGAGFNWLHVASMTQALCDIRHARGTFGPELSPALVAAFTANASGKPGVIIMGKDVRFTSDEAQIVAAEVFAANGFTIIINKDGRATPTPVVSHSILARNLRGEAAEGVVITASHNPPDDAGYKSNGLNGGPNTETKPIDQLANKYMANPEKIRRMDYADAVKKGLIIETDLVTPYVEDLSNVVRMEVIKSGGKFAATSLGGSAWGYYSAIAAKYGLDLTELLGTPDPAGEHRTYDWDGRLRGDPSSTYVMQAVAGLRKSLNALFLGANDNDADRFGAEDSTGILNPNHVLCVLFDYLAKNRGFDATMGIGRTIGTTHMLDLIAATQGRPSKEVPVGFKWYVDGLINSKYVLAGEESAGLSFPRLNGQPWVTEKDGIATVLLMMEICANTGKDIGTLYGELVSQHGQHLYERIDLPATAAKKALLAQLAANSAGTNAMLEGKRIAGKRVERTVIGDGVKVVLEGGIWVLKRASGTEDIIKDYREERGETLDTARQASQEIDSLLGLDKA